MITDLTEVMNANTLSVETSHAGPADFTDDDTADCGSATTGQARWSCSTHSAARRRNGESRKHRTQQRFFFGPSTLGLRRSFKRSEGRDSLPTMGKGIEGISSGHSVQIRSRRILPSTGWAAGDDYTVSFPVHSTAGGEAHSDHIRRRHTHLAQ